MYTYESLMLDMKQMEIDNGGTVLIHSSCRNIGAVNGRGHTIIDVWMDYMNDGLLVLPTHTWSNVLANENNTMDVMTTPVCIGVLPEIFRMREHVYRSLHPTHSVAAFGKDAQEFVKGDEFAKTPCPINSTWHKLLERKATILLVGVNFTRNTFIHGIEEWTHVRGTLSEKVHDLYVTAPDGKKYYTPQNRHCAPLGSQTFWKIEPIMLREGVMRLGRFGGATVQIVYAEKLYKILSEIIKMDNQVLMTNLPLEKRFFENCHYA